MVCCRFANHTGCAVGGLGRGATGGDAMAKQQPGLGHLIDEFPEQTDRPPFTRHEPRPPDFVLVAHPAHDEGAGRAARRPN